MALHFTEQEFEFRKNKIIKSMKEKNLDALLLFRQESMYWLTGYDTFGYVFFQCLVITLEGNKKLLTRAADLRQAQNTSNIKDIRIWVDRDNNNPVEEEIEVSKAVIKSPIVGTAYLGPEPGAKPFVSVGKKIKKGETVIIVEAMKTMNHVPSTLEGIV